MNGKNFLVAATLVSMVIICLTIQHALALEENTDRPGMNIGSGIYLSSPDPALCEQACTDSPECKAFTYVKPGFRGPNSQPECWLKNDVPDPVQSDCCISGVKYKLEYTNISVLQPNFDRLELKPQPSENMDTPLITGFSGPEDLYVRPGYKVSILGKFFSPDTSKNKIGIRKLNSPVPPQKQDFVGELILLTANSGELVAEIPNNIPTGKYSVWVYVEGAGHSNSIDLDFGPKKPETIWPCKGPVSPNYPGPSGYEYDLAAVDWCWKSSLGKISFYGIVKNVGTKTMKVEDTGYIYGEGNYLISASMPSGYTKEVPSNFYSGWELAPGETAILDIPVPVDYADDNQYGSITVIVKHPMDQNPSNDEHFFALYNKPGSWVKSSKPSCPNC